MKRSFDSRVDYSLLLPVFCLLVIGVAAIYIAVSHDYPNNVLPILGQQIAWIALGLVIGFVVMFFNTEFLWKVTPYLYGLGLALMVLPLVFYNPNLEPSQDTVNLVSWHPNLMQEGTSILAYKDCHEAYNCSHSCRKNRNDNLPRNT